MGMTPSLQRRCDPQWAALPAVDQWDIYIDLAERNGGHVAAILTAPPARVTHNSITSAITAARIAAHYGNKALDLLG